MSVEAYDFRKPTRLAGGLEQRLAAWLEVACAWRRRSGRSNCLTARNGVSQGRNDPAGRRLGSVSRNGSTAYTVMVHV